MVYHFRTVKCPNCGEIADRTRTVDSQILRGSPFRVCPYCDNVYFDSAYQEIALSVYKDKGGVLNFWGLAWALISNGLVVFFLLTSSLEDLKGGLWIPLLIFGLIAIIIDTGLVRLIKNRIHANEYHQQSLDLLEGKTNHRTKDLTASMERMSNKSYLDALRAHGVTVPDYFYERLRTVKPENSIQVPDSIKSVDSSMVNQTNTEDPKKEVFENSPKNEIAFCRKCGARIPLDSVFCPKCGEKVIK